MSERLKFFRKLMSAFEGTSNPQRAVERGFYVKLPNSPIREITRRIEVNPSSIKILLGGIGAGKTTQLLLTQSVLNELEDIQAIYVDVSLFTDISNLQAGALIAIAGLELINILGDMKNTILEKCKKRIEKVAHGYSETVVYVPEQSLEPWEEQISLDYQGILSLNNKKQKIIESLVQDLSTLKEAVKQKIAKEIVFLFDGLDRIADPQLFFESALNDARMVREIAGIGSIIVGSVAITQMLRENIKGLLVYLPYLDVFDSVEAKQFFIDIMGVRDPDNIFTSDARSLLISCSGGVLRDFISISQMSIEEAYLDGADRITAQHVEQAILPFVRLKLMGLNASEMTILRIFARSSFFPSNSEHWELLHTGHILEYRYPKPRFIVHPAIAAVIENKIVTGVLDD
ncbi:MAG: hypothetical protein ACK5QS_13340 [Pseudanabaenaceae cyanobacterium]|jgi:hypothetical protein